MGYSFSGLKYLPEGMRSEGKLVRQRDTGLPFELHSSEGLVGPEVPPPEHSQPGHTCPSTMVMLWTVPCPPSCWFMNSFSLCKHFQELPGLKAIHPLTDCPILQKFRARRERNIPFLAAQSPWVAQSQGAESYLPLLGNVSVSLPFADRRVLNYGWNIF